MRYTISETAELLGVTTHMLRHYEKVGIIRPETSEESGYRYYSVIDTRRFNLSRSLLASGIPLHQCAEIMSTMPVADVEALIDGKIAEQQRQLERMRIVLQHLKATKEYYATLDEKVGAIWMENHPRMWSLNLSHNEKPYTEQELRREKEEWLECMPAVTWVSRIRSEVLGQFSEGEIEYGYGLMCYEDDAKALGLRRTQRVEIVPGGDYLVTLMRKTERGPFTWEDIHALTAYMQARRLSFFGDAFSFIAASRIEDGVEANYHVVLAKVYT